jgi:hypothetical protein
MVINFLSKRSPLSWPRAEGGALRDMGHVAPQPFAAGGIQLFSYLRVVIGVS